MELECLVILPDLSSKRDLWSSRTEKLIAHQLKQQGRRSSNSYRYEVSVEIVEGEERPATDIDNYAKKIIDAITRTQLLWRDDEQIDTLIIRRKRNRRLQASKVVVRTWRTEGQHSGIPTFFRACCHEAKFGSLFTYSHPGYHLAIHLWDQQPFDLSEFEWDKRIENLYKLLNSEDAKGVWNWFYEHFPKCMKLVPKRRMEQFIKGVNQAYEEGRIDG